MADPETDASSDKPYVFVVRVENKIHTVNIACWPTGCSQSSISCKCLSFFSLNLHVQFCAKSEDNFQNVPIISYKTTIVQKIILKTFLIQFW